MADWNPHVIHVEIPNVKSRYNANVTSTIDRNVHEYAYVYTLTEMLNSWSGKDTSLFAHPLSWLK